MQFLFFVSTVATCVKIVRKFPDSTLASSRKCVPATKFLLLFVSELATSVKIVRRLPESTLTVRRSAFRVEKFYYFLSVH